MNHLLAIDGSSCSQAASDMLIRLRLPRETEVTVLHVLEPAPPLASGMQRWEDIRAHVAAEREQSQRMLEAEASRLEKAGLRPKTVVRDGNAAHAILDTAHEENSDMILVGSHGRGAIGRFVLGSVSHNVVNHAGCSVLIARAKGGTNGIAGSSGGKGAPTLKVLHTFDASPTSRAVTNALADAPWLENADVTIVAVLDVVSLFRTDLVEVETNVFREHEEETRKGVSDAAELLRPASSRVSTIVRVSSRPHREILDIAAELDVDLIVVGDKGLGAVHRFLLGSVAHRIVNHAQSSVLIMRP